jgi:hypothetical protein
MTTGNNPIEEIILSNSHRGIESVKNFLPPGYCKRAAKLILDNPGTVLIGTGFPVKGTFETDGPVGAIGLYKVLEQLGYTPLFVCAPPISRTLSKKYHTHEMPIVSWEQSLLLAQAALEELGPALVISVERPGVTENGRYYNMRMQDITDYAAKYDVFFQLCSCPTLAFGDGGNEIGMGNIRKELKHLPIAPSVTTCDELVIAAVSNWGVYGVLAAMSAMLQKDLFDFFDPEAIIEFLVANGSIDGITRRPENSEDGFPLTVGLNIIAQLRKTITAKPVG